jgi:hypothetical protein
MKWLQTNAGWILSLVAVGWLSYALARALVISWRARQTTSVTEDFSRGEKVRQDIRRKIADRKANPDSAAVPAARGPDASRSPRGVPPLDPFGGPARRGWWRRVRSWFGSNR